MDVSQYLEIFIDETSEHIQSLSDCIMTLEKEPDNKDTINEIFRAAHSLKGMAGTMGFKRMQHLTHDMENVFQEVRSDKVKVTSDMIDLLFQCLDAIEGYLDTIKETSDEGTEDNEAIIKGLNAFLENAEGKDAPQDETVAAKTEQETQQPQEVSDQKKYLEIESVLLPNPGSVNLPEEIVVRNRDALVYGACARLMRQAGKPWFSMEMAEYYQQKFFGEIQRAIADSRYEHETESTGFSG